MRNETIAIHAGYEPDPTTKSVAVPIYQTVAYDFDSADHGAALFNLEVDGYRYSRIANPTTAVLEERVAALEGGVGALARRHRPGRAALRLRQSSPMPAAISSPCRSSMARPTPCSSMSCRGRASMRASPSSDQPDAIEKLIDENTRAVFCESIGNPAGNVCDIEALARVAHRHGVPLIVDNTVATPILLQPIRLRRRYRRALADEVYGRPRHDAGRRDRRQRQVSPGQSIAERFPMFNEPDASYHGLVYTEHFGASGLYRRAAAASTSAPSGSVLSPFSAFLLLQGIETVALRVERHVENARKVAEFLRNDPRVAWVNYAGFPDSPYYAARAEISRRQRAPRCSPSASRAAAKRARNSTTR